MKRIQLIRFLLLAGTLLIGSCAIAQQAAVASGGDATGSGGTLAYSVGQVVYTTASGSTGSVEQGVQHAYDITTEIKSTEFAISLSVFPNPTADNLTLQIENLDKETLTYEIFDIHGKYLMRGSVLGNKTPISLTGYTAATYFLNIMQEGQQIQSFKVIKNY